MSTYLGLPVRLWIGWAVSCVALVVGLAVAGALPSPPDCPPVLEEGVWLEGSCVTVEELEERLAQIRAERSGERSWSNG